MQDPYPPIPSTQIYMPETIPDTPFPTVTNNAPATLTVTGGTPQNSNGIATQPTITPNPVPDTVTAQELISTQLNTQTQKILSAFSFQAQGAIKIGDAVAGESGEIDISSDGILAKNVEGNTTFAIDGETGDATFAGELVAGTIISGSISVANGSTVIDENGISSVNQFIWDTLSSGSHQSTANMTYTDVSGSAFNITTDFPRVVLFILGAGIRQDSPQFQQNGYTMNIKLVDSLLGDLITITGAGIPGTYIDGSNHETLQIATQAVCAAEAVALQPGSHDFKLQFEAVGGGNANIDSFAITIVIF